jgi:four helix bundle protein
MSRKYRALRVFRMADQLALEIYRLTRLLPPDERYGLTSELRRSALSVPQNLVVGCYRRTTRDFLHSIAIAMASAAETEYGLDISVRLRLLPRDDARTIRDRYLLLLRSLQKLTQALQPAAEAARPSGARLSPRASRPRTPERDRRPPGTDRASDPNDQSPTPL